MQYISYENQIERLNRIVSQMEVIAQLPKEVLLDQPAEGVWSVLETVVHMNKAYAPHYRDQLHKILENAPELDAAPTEFRGGRVASFLYSAMRPQDGRRKMKMKTLKKFRPQQEDIERLDTVFAAFFDHQQTLKMQILKARNRDISGKKLPSAIGWLIQFTVPECLEFVISHEERHLLQCEETLSAYRLATNSLK